MNVHLSPALAEMVKEQVGAGRYASASEVVREALRLFEERESLRAMRLEALRANVQAAIEQADRGETEPFDERDLEDIEKRGSERLAARRKAAAGA